MTTGWRRIIPLIGILLVVGAIYDGAVFYSRWNRDQRAKQAQAEREAENARKAIDSIGGGDLKIISFYAGAGEICYGVTGAKTVRIEPSIGETWPALSRCMQASPRKDTEYKLTAEDGAGHSTTERIVVKVH